MIKALFIYVLLTVSPVMIAIAQPAFKGGQPALDEFLKSKIVYPEYSRQNCISGAVDVVFQLDKNGTVNSAKVQQGLGIDLDDEALRVIKLTSGHWIIPANYNQGTKIIQRIRFSPDVLRCGIVASADMEAAIANYKVQQELENAVTNYYINKRKGTADISKEAYIIALKKQLGYDDDFINDVLDQASEKLKQGDKDGACTTWNFIRNIGSDKADGFISKYCDAP